MGGCGRLPSLPRQTLVIPAPSHRHSGESRNPEGRGGEGDGVLCLSLDTRVRGYDVGQRGYDGAVRHSGESRRFSGRNAHPEGCGGEGRVERVGGALVKPTGGSP